MRKRILLFSLLITFAGIVLFSFTSTQVYYNSSIEHSKDYLRVYMNSFGDEYALDEEGAKSFSDDLGGVRVTFLDLRGGVLGDSDSEKVTENHLDRAEVIQALKEGEGFAVRSSATVGSNLIYYCKYFEEYGALVRIAVPTSSEWALYAKALPAVAGYLVLDVLLCLLFTYIATYFLLNPVKKIAYDASSAEKITTKYSELKPIADILNERNRNIRRQMDEIKEEKELVERARSSKDEFISNVTHEMNTPLTSIRGYAELLSAGALSEEQKQKAYKTIMTQSDRLTSLISGIINYSEIDSDDLPDYEVDFSALARETLSALRPEADEHGVTIIEEIADNIKIMSRHERLSEILGNLVRNAVRYNREGGSVTVKLDYNRLTVSDTGIGIAEEDLERVFDRFYTVDKSHNGKNGGFGLGLAVVKKICNKSGWKITVNSKKGEGSEFTVTF